MKKAGQIVRRAGVPFLALFALAAFLCLDGVDHRPYFREPYYQQTAARLASSITTNKIERGQLFAGFGQARLTPTLNAAADNPAEGQFQSIPLAGYGNRQGRPATGVHDDLFVKAAALRVNGLLGVMFGIDALIVPREVSDEAAARLQKELGLSRAQLYFSASHTHCSLGGWGEGLVGEAFAGGFNPGSRAWFVECVVRAAHTAVADLQPAQLGHGRFEARPFIRNRLVGDLGRVDPEFSYALIKQTSGRTGILGSFSAHATVLSADMMQFSADYPGCWQRAIEQATGGVAIFLAGGVGSHSPVAPERGFPGALQMGQSLASNLLSNLDRVALSNAPPRLPSVHRPATNQIAFGILALDVSLPEFNTRLTDGIRLRPWLTQQLLPPHRDSFLQGFRLGDTIWLSTPCDFSGELALDLKDFARARGGDAVVTSFNGDYIGYVIPSRYYHLDGYEPRTMSFYGPAIPDYLDELLRSITRALLD